MRLFQYRQFILFIVFAGLSLAPAKGQVFFLRDTFCSNQIFIVNGHLYGSDNPSGTEILPGAAANGADSIIEVRLVFLQPATTKLEKTLCQYDTLWVNGVAYHAGFSSGVETVENGAYNGCDSIIQVNLSFKDQVVVNLTQVICEGDSVIINGTAYSALHPAGKEILPTAGGCDSIVQINLTPIPLPFTQIIDTLCPDSSLTINGHRYDKDNRSGLEIIPGASMNGCDSLVNIRLFFRELWVSLGDDLTFSAGDSICLMATTNFSPTAIEWSPALPCSTPDCSITCVVLYQSQYVQVQTTDISGCVVSDEINIGVNKKPPVYAPNVFKQAGSWPNNYFYLGAGRGISLINKFEIVDRWGDIILERENIQPDNPLDGWDGNWKGKAAPPGVYVYWAELERWDGTREVVSGAFTLVR